jgi:hypothetical protein
MDGVVGGSSGFFSALLFSWGLGVAPIPFTEELDGLMRKAEGLLDRNNSKMRVTVTVKYVL